MKASTPTVRRGFTLLEAVVVAGALAVATIAATSALTRARADARAMQCQSALRLLGVAMHVYADGQSDWYPPHALDNKKIPWFANAQYRTILGLDPKTKAVPPEMLCPERPEARKNNLTNTYGQNATGATAKKPKGAPPGTPDTYIRRGDVQSPQRKVMLHDANDWSTRSSGADAQKGWDKTGEKTGKEGGRSGIVAYRHGESANVLHHDLSAALYGKDELCPRTASGAASKPGLEKIWRLYGSTKKKPAAKK